MKKICLCVSSFSGGGAERVMVTLANKFVEWGYQVDFIVNTDRGPYKNMLNPMVNKVVFIDDSKIKVRKLYLQPAAD